MLHRYHIGFKSKVFILVDNDTKDCILLFFFPCKNANETLWSVLNSIEWPAFPFSRDAFSRRTIGKIEKYGKEKHTCGETAKRYVRDLIYNRKSFRASARSSAALGDVDRRWINNNEKEKSF